MAPHTDARDFAAQEDAARAMRQRAGMTLMAWGLLSAAMLITHGLVGPDGLLRAVLWAPFVALGAAVTWWSWRRHQAPIPGRQAAACLAAAILLAGLIHLAMQAAWTLAATLTAGNSLLAFAFAVATRRSRGWTHLVGAGTAMALGSAMLSLFPTTTQPWAAAAIVGVSWLVAGNAVARQP